MSVAVGCYIICSPMAAACTAPLDARNQASWLQVRGYDTGELATCRRFLETAVELRSWVSLPFRITRRVFAFAERGARPCWLGPHGLRYCTVGWHDQLVCRRCLQALQPAACHMLLRHRAAAA